jgi:diacylglycerol kinase family enzyme
MHLMLIVNTSASSVTPRVRVMVQKTLSGGHDVVCKETNRRGHAARLAQGAAADGFDAVVVLAGDGTLNEAVNGLAGSQTALAALPGGSTNVFARTIGTSSDPVEAARQLLAALAEGSLERVGLGQANGRYFLLHAGIGFDAAVVAGVEKRASLKRYTGPAAFLLAALSCWVGGYDRKHPAFSVSTGDVSVDGAYFSLFLNSDPYTFLGNRPLHVAPGTPLGGPMSLVTFDKLTLATLLPVAAAALGQGVKGGKRPHFMTARDVKRATVVGRHPVPYQLDGDYAGEAQRIELTWSGEELLIVIPDKGRAFDDRPFQS